MILISENCNENCNCGDTCVGGLTCHCGGNQSETQYICPGGNCGGQSQTTTNCNCNCNCGDPTSLELAESDILGTRRLVRLIAPTRDTHTNWTAIDPVIPEGVMCFTYDRLFNGSIEYVVGDGTKRYSQLPKFAGATMSATSVANTGVLRDGNGKIDRDSLPVATSSQYGVVKASTAGGAGQAILGDANGKYNFGDDATLDPSCLNAGVIPSGVTIPASQVTGMPDSVAYATNAGHANNADTATSATTAATATNAAHATTADSANTAASATTAATAGKLAEAQRITVQMTVDGSTVGGYADFDGDNAITINMLPAITTGGSGGSDDGYGDAFSSVGGYAELDASKFYVRMSSNQSYQTIKYRNDKEIIEDSVNYSIYASSVEGVDWSNINSRKKIFVKTPNVGTTYAVKGRIQITTGEVGENSEQQVNNERINITGIPANTYFELTASNNGNTNSQYSAQIPDDPYKLYLVRTA